MIHCAGYADEGAPQLDGVALVDNLADQCNVMMCEGFLENKGDVVRRMVYTLR